MLDPQEAHKGTRVAINNSYPFMNTCLLSIRHYIEGFTQIAAANLHNLGYPHFPDRETEALRADEFAPGPRR